MTDESKDKLLGTAIGMLESLGVSRHKFFSDVNQYIREKNA